jgi:hypothetical protein
MRGIRPGHVTVTLVSAFAAMCLVTTTYAFLHVPAPSAGKAAATVDVVTAGEITRTISGMDLAAMKSKVMTYDVQHQQTQTTTAVVQAPAKPAVVTAPPSTPPPAPPPVVTDPNTAPAGDYSYSGLEQLWEANGGSAGVAATAACIAEHESSGNPGAFNGRDIGLWQIDPDHDPGGDLYNPAENARIAVAVSSDGTNWGPWTTAPACGV